MSFAGFKKQINKANQYVSEKIGGAEKTKLDEEFVEMERKVDVTFHAVEDIIARTTEFLQPNPVTRAKLSTANTMSKMRGQSKVTRYPQPEGNLGDVFLKYNKDLGEDSIFGLALGEAGETYKQLAEIKDSLDFNVKQNFLDPLEHLKTKELKEINIHRKKLEGRRLDFDCKKRKQHKGAAVPEEEIRMAEEKFDESREIVENGMRNLLESDVEQVRQLQALVEAQIEFHQQAQSTLNQLSSTLAERISEGENRPRTDYKPKRNLTTNSHHSDDSDDVDLRTAMSQPQVAPPTSVQVCKALYDFEPENEGELAFSEGDIIKLVTEIDENWLEGEVNGISGYFPRNYVEIQGL